MTIYLITILTIFLITAILIGIRCFRDAMENNEINHQVIINGNNNIVSKNSVTINNTGINTGVIIGNNNVIGNSNIVVNNINISNNKKQIKYICPSCNQELVMFGTSGFIPKCQNCGDILKEK